MKAIKGKLSEFRLPGIGIRRNNEFNCNPPFLEVYSSETGELIPGIRGLTLKAKVGELPVCYLEIVVNDVSIDNVKDVVARFHSVLTGKKFKLVECEGDENEQ